jgi:hypothetical protein
VTFQLTTEELLRVLKRKEFANNLLVERLVMVTAENAELLSIIDEIQTDLAEARAVLSDLQASTEVESDHGDLHAVSHHEAGVPGR